MIKNTSKIIALTAALVIGLSPILSTAQGIPLKLQAAIFQKVLAYDSGLATRSTGGVIVTIVLDSNTSKQKADILKDFRILKQAAIQGKGVTLKALVFNEQSFSGDVAQLGGNILYLPKGSRSKTVASVIKLGRDQVIPVLAGDEKIVKKGAAVGLAVISGKPKILVNFDASKQQGMKLSAKLLQLAKVIR